MVDVGRLLALSFWLKACRSRRYLGGNVRRSGRPKGGIAMTELAELTQIIDSCYTIFAREISEPEQNVLRLVLQEAEKSPEAVAQKIGGTVIEDLHPVEPTERSRTFELKWKQYIAYSVTSESFGLPDDHSAVRASGRLFRTYSKSHFLDFVSRATIATDQYPGPSTHFCVVSECHVIDIISTQMPEIQILRTGSVVARDRRSFVK